MVFGRVERLLREQGYDCGLLSERTVVWVDGRLNSIFHLTNIWHKRHISDNFSANTTQEILLFEYIFDSISQLYIKTLILTAILRKDCIEILCK